MSNKIKVKYGNTELFSIDYPYNALDIKYKNNIVSTIYPEETVGLNTKEKLFDGNFDIAGYTLNTDGTRCRENIFVSNELPYEELEYIESTGTQWIDTNICVSPNINFQIAFAPIGNSDSSWRGIFGSRTSSTSTDNITLWWQYGTMNSAMSVSSGDVLFTYRMTSGSTTTFKKIGNNYYVNNDLQATTSLALQQGSRNIYLFKCNTGDGEYEKSPIRLYSFTLLDNTTTTINLIPVRRKSDRTICLYDTITKSFFTNQGTGDFIAGPTIDYTRLKYIESTGTQCILTNHYLKSSDSVQGEFQFVEGASVTNVHMIFGGNYHGPGNGYRLFGLSQSNSVQIQYADSETGITLGDNTWYGKHTFKINRNGNVFEIDNSSVSLSTSSFTSTKLNLFASNEADQSSYISRFRLFSFELFEYQENKVYSFIPVRRSNGEIGMLDRVSYTFYRNQGVGEFIGGPEV